MGVDSKAMFKIECGLFVAGVAWEGKRNACICNTLMQQSHTPVKVTVTLEKTHLTHDMALEKRSLCISALKAAADSAVIRRFGFASGREKDKFEDFPCGDDALGNPRLDGEHASAAFSLEVYDTADMGTHTMFLCHVTETADYPGESLTYNGYRAQMQKK